MAGKGLKKEVKIKFIIPQNCESKDETNENMQMAFQECTEKDLFPEWVLESNVNEISFSKNTVIVLQEFAGSTFEHLRSKKSVRLVGPMCLRSCLASALPIPENKSPVFTTGMRDVIVTASQVPPAVKAALKERIGFMGGVYVNNLIEAATHLVANAVTSAKYELAGEKGIPVLTQEWVEFVWRESRLRNMRGTDPDIIRRFKCPVFYNLSVSTSNLSKPDREEVKRLITDNGGTFTLQMKQNETMLLVTNEPQGEKFKHARLWGLPCVKTSYVRDSVRAGHALPFKNHLVEPSVQMKCSTPTKDGDFANFTYNTEAGMISMINMDSSKVNIDESQATMCSSFASTQSNKPARPSGSQHAPIVDKLTVADAKKAGTFMDGCRIFLSGFSPTEGEKLRRILSVGGATLFPDLSDSVSHVVVGEFIVTDMKAIAHMAQKPHVVTIEWLVASMKQRCPATEEPYFCMAANRSVPEPPSPLSQKLLKRADEEDSATEKMPPPTQTAVPRKLFSEFVKENAKSPAKTPRANNSTMSASTTLSESTIAEIFVGQKFVIAGFSSETVSVLEEHIEASGGCVVAADFSGVADYAVVPPQQSVPNITAVEVVTHLWLEECWDMKEVLPVQYYHQPFPVSVDKQPLADCCVSLSNYTGKEKVFLTQLLQLLGATYQDVFSRVTKPDKNVMASTHLVCPVADGQKYKAAVRWKLPVITKDWLLACAKQGAKVNETPYLVDAESAKTPEPKSDSSAVGVTPFVDMKAAPPNVVEQQKLTPVMSKPAASTSADSGVSMNPAATTPVSRHVTNDISFTATPLTSHPLRRHSSVKTPDNSSPAPGPSFVTPNAVNSLKRKSSVRTPDDCSPFHVTTPDTPYGQALETPTAESKKRWKKFIDDFPVANSIPSAKKKRQSTPLSELKRRIWAAALEEGDSAKPSSSESGNPNYSIEEMDDDLPSAQRQFDCENIQPKRSLGRATPNASDFNVSTEARDTGSSGSTPSCKKNSTGKRSTNEAVSALLGDLHERLSTGTPGSAGVRRQLPQRELVTPPEPPTLANKPASSLLPESQPILLGWEDPVESAERAKISKSSDKSIEPENPRIRKFVLSNVEEREKYQDLLTSLGETVITSQSYDAETTHLIMDKPVRSEKLLCCIAAGKWILHTSYIDDMASKGKTSISEADYEWGSELSVSRLPKLTGNSLEQELAAAAVRWRTQLQSQPGCGAFTGLRILLVTSTSKHDSMKRFITAGGGTILPHTSFEEATHCIVDANKVSSLPVSLSQLVACKVPCLPTLFLSDLLLKFPPPQVQDRLLDEYRALLNKQT